MVDDRGGKVAMTLALSNPSLDISNLIISDIAPTQTPLSHQYLEAMTEIEDPANDIRTREQAGKVLEAIEKVISPLCIFRVLSELCPSTGFGSTPISAHQSSAPGSSRYFSHDGQIPDPGFSNKTFGWCPWLLPFLHGQWT